MNMKGQARIVNKEGAPVINAERGCETVNRERKV